MKRIALLTVLLALVGCSDDERGSTPSNCKFEDGVLVDTCPGEEVCVNTGDIVGDQPVYECGETCMTAGCPDGEVCVSDFEVSYCRAVPDCDFNATSSEECTGVGCSWLPAVEFTYDGTTCSDSVDTNVCVGRSVHPCMNGCPGAMDVREIEGEDRYVLLITDNGVVGSEWSAADGQLFNDCPDVVGF